VNRSIVRFLAVAAIAALAACSGTKTGGMLPSGGDGASLSRLALTPSSPELGVYKRVCDSVLPGRMRCDAIMRVDEGRTITADMLTSDGAKCDGKEPPCYGPAGLQKAYNIVNASKNAGKNMTVALVDAYGYPGVQKDLALYRKTFGLPACGKGCFSVVSQLGKTSGLPPIGPSYDDWRGEQALDIEMVSAICPNCKIILVQTKDDSNDNLAAGVDAAVKLHANAISNSYGCPESNPQCGPAASSPDYDHAGVMITASAGDSGAAASQPCAFSSVVCVGGTSLNLANSSRGFTETVWDGLVKNQCGSSSDPSPCATGSGCSSYVSKPSWQKDKGCTWRSESDVSAEADPYTGVIVSCTPCVQPGHSPLFSGEGGTSASSPMIAAMYALAGNAKSQTGQTLWAHNGKGFNDVTKGTNENARAQTFICPAKIKYICNAGPGYDGPTGWGTPNGLSGL
jgi:subtilase family serine protease